MNIFHRISRVALGGFLVAGATLAGASSPVHRPVTGEDLAPSFASSCIGYCVHPTNAAKVQRWGVEEWRREFEDRDTRTVEGTWLTNTPGSIEQREGMLTIHAAPTDAEVVVDAADQAAAYGRWEARVRAVETSTGAATFDFVWELASDTDEHCGADDIVLSHYKPGQARARGSVNTLPNNQFRFSRELDLRSRAWHTYAVEVTDTHIAWFVDTQVIRTERRDAALSGVTLHPQFRIVGEVGQQMNQSMMQMDWVRYYDLHRPNAQPIKAPRMKHRVNPAAC